VSAADQDRAHQRSKANPARSGGNAPSRQCRAGRSAPAKARGFSRVVGVHDEMEGRRRSAPRQQTASRPRRRKAIEPGAVRFRRLPSGQTAGRMFALASQMRLDVRADQSISLKRNLERGDLDLALLKRDASEKGGASWPERLHWVTSKTHPRNLSAGSVPSIGFPEGCLYRSRDPRAEKRRPQLAHGLHLLEPRRHPGGGGRRLGLSFLAEIAILPITACSLPRTVLRRTTARKLRWWPRPMPARRPSGSPIALAEFCDSEQVKAA
jgi:hypothetical protein